MSEQEHPASVVEPVGRQGARVEIQQRQAAMITGWLGVAVLFGLAAATYAAIQTQAGGWVISLPIIAFCLVASSIVIVPPGQSRVVQFFGTYVGTVRRPGFWCVWPLAVRRAVSIRVRNFETNRLKVNDADGNPVEI
ncbi:MAG TPA: SPFH domain-containing protein, partial [Ktedonobacteraceae bacterium]